MRIVCLNLLIVLMMSLAFSQNDLSSHQESLRAKNKRILTGSILLGAEYITGYSLAYKMWWPEGFRKINPFSNIGEKEPFFVDDVIHAIGNIVSQDIHYAILKNYFHVQSPWPSMILTSVSWFSIEALDAMEKRNGWRFSINDELGNLSGVLFWYYKHNNPDSPLYLRLGFRQWGNAVEYIKDLPLLFTDRDVYGKQHNHDKYSILKTELIYMFKQNVYAGIAVSRASENSQKNTWGITAGWDVVSNMNSLESNRYNVPLKFIRNNFTLNISLTYWNDQRITPI